jgi:uncharacterized repeat protein (TIGR01451 family)
MHPFLKSCLAAAALLLAQAALAQAPVVTSTLVAHRVETVAGKAVLKPADAGKPGDLVEYSGTYHNGGAKPVDKLVATIPVPAGTTFVSGSAAPARAQASTDGVRFAPMPLMHAVKHADGSVHEEPMPLSEYRYVRWELGTLAAGADSTVALRVQIDSAATAANTRP